MIQRKTPLVRKTGVRKRAPVQRCKESSMHSVYEQKAANDDHFCTGCGATHNLTHSHIISRTDKELMDDPRNITYHCANIYGRNGCSWRWEQVGERTALSDYIQNMDFIAEVRPLIFSKMIVDDYSFLQKNEVKICSYEVFDYICSEFKNL